MQTIGLVINTRKPNAIEAAKKLLSQLTLDNYNINLSDEVKYIFSNQSKLVRFLPEAESIKRSKLILTFGGDGTFLRTIQMVGKNEIPILGVNVGSLGFLAAASIGNVKIHVEEFFQSKIQTEVRSLLKLKIKGKNKNYYALNDFVIDKAGFYRVINIKTEIDQNLLNTYIADGLIISTPTGSTAYSLANGGPILMPQTGAFIVNPVCPHTLTNRPVIISDQSEITLEVRSELGKFNIFGDGQIIGTYKSGTKIEIIKSEFNAKLVKIPEQSFYLTLQTKLGWGEDFRNKTRWNSNKNS